MTRSLVVWGCTSSAGKSFITTALCRLAARRGLAVAPFKAQNMSNNARVVPRGDGEAGEIGSAQYFQALAAGVVPTTDMNPVLLKPERDTASQVVLDGRAEPALSRLPWRERSVHLALAAEKAFTRLAGRHELIVIEGAGSPAEINLAAHDYVNLGSARWARAAGPAAALLVSDIDRGGSFAHCHGTWALLPPDLQPLLEGFLFNRFRGDAALLAPGPAQLQALTGVPLAGVLPLMRDHGLPEEDAMFDDRPRAVAGAASDRADAPRRVAVLAPPHLSNLDEFQPLLAVPGLHFRWAREPAHLAELGEGDWLVLPGSKQVSGDLAWLRRQGLDEAVRAHAARGRPLLGICGGLQMLGLALHDPQGHDGEPVHELPGLGLLPLRTVFGPEKRLRAAPVRFGTPEGAWSALAGVRAEAYEIRCGHTEVASDSTTPSAAVTPMLFDAAGQAIGWQRGPVLGLYAHGLLESPAVLQALFGTAVPTLQSRFDRIADELERELDATLLRRWLGA